MGYINAMAALEGLPRALLCDDEAVCRMQAGRVLKQCGLEVVQTSSGDETILVYEEAEAAGRPFTIIVMDNMLGVDVMCGSECITKLRMMGCSCKILMFTGSEIDAERAAEFKTAGANMSVKKPLQVPLVRSLLRIRASIFIPNVPPTAAASDTSVEALAGIDGAIFKRQLQREGTIGEIDLISVEHEATPNRIDRVSSAQKENQVLPLPSMVCAAGGRRQVHDIQPVPVVPDGGVPAFPQMVVRGVEVS